MIIRKLFAFLCICFIAYSCENRRVSNVLRSFQKSVVVIPEDLQSVDNRDVVLCGEQEECSPVLIIYYDSLSCSTCQIGHLTDLLELYELSDSLGTFKVMTIFSPKQEEYDDVIKNLMLKGFEYPVYVDYRGSFRRKNSCIPADSRFHSFLTDKSGHPVYVGNPIASDGLWNLFLKVLQNISS